ncbi:hypothetical protein [Aeromicrobium sp. 179-A 4D2 NHS]|uniref:hypothetical protein n=1 Tax=Aeromicrobium sp. 179-A 4D2 NHS TaxID=3142375 RepID=UPI0039A1BC8A
MDDRSNIEKIYAGVLGRFEKHYERHGAPFLKATIGAQHRNVLVPTYVGQSGHRFFGWRMQEMKAFGGRLPAFVEADPSRDMATNDEIAMQFARHMKELSGFVVETDLRSFSLDPAYLTNRIVPWVITVRPTDLDDDWQWSTATELRSYMHSAVFAGVVNILDREFRPSQ